MGGRGGPRKPCSHKYCTKQAIRKGVCYRHGAVYVPIKCSTDGCTNNSIKNGRCRYHNTVAAAERTSSNLPAYASLSPVEICTLQAAKIRRLEDLVSESREENNHLKALLQQEANEKVARKSRGTGAVQLPMPKQEVFNKEVIQWREWKTITESLDVHDENDRVIISFMKGCIAKNIIEDWVASTKEMAEKLGKKHLYHTDTKRYKNNSNDQMLSGHFFSWRKYQAFPHLTSLMKFSSVQDWATKNKPFWDRIEEIFKLNFPTLYTLYNSVANIPMRAGGFATVAVNFDVGPLKAHRDEGDYQNGICLVAVGGDFTGGEISFPELKMKFDVQPGDVIAFRSYLLLHEVLKL